MFKTAISNGSPGMLAPDVPRYLTLPGDAPPEKLTRSDPAHFKKITPLLFLAATSQDEGFQVWDPHQSIFCSQLP